VAQKRRWTALVRRDREHGRAERGARVIVDEVDDLDVGAVRQVPVGHIALPALVGKFRGEANPTGAGPLLGLGRDEPATHQHAVNGGERRGGRTGLFEVILNGASARVDVFIIQALAPRDDLVFLGR